MFVATQMVQTFIEWKGQFPSPFLSRPPRQTPALGFIRIFADLLRKKYIYMKDDIDTKQ